MNPDLDRALCERYPKLFARRHDRTSCMAEGFSCEDGWHHVIDALCFCVQAETDQHGAPQLVVRQVKQKFGSLRFHVGPDATPRQRAMIELAQSVALRTCEICGSPADGADDVLSVRCEAHRTQNLTIEQRAQLDAFSAAYSRRLHEIFSAPDSRERLRLVATDPIKLDGQVLAGVEPSPDQRLQALLAEERAKRGLAD